MSKHGVAAAIGCVLTTLLLAGCGGSAQSFADDDAAATAEAITHYLQDRVAVPGRPAAEQLGKVRRWLAAPSEDYVKSFTQPDLKILSATDRQVEIVVYEYGRSTVMDGKKSAWGFACRRYTVDTADRLRAESISCPSGLSRDPNQ